MNNMYVQIEEETLTIDQTIAVMDLIGKDLTISVLERKGDKVVLSMIYRLSTYDKTKGAVQKILNGS